MNTTDSLENIFKTIYKNKGYFTLYGGSVFATFIILLVFFIVFSYFFVMNDLSTIRKNWTTNRCNPAYIPFAGIINKDPHKSVFDSTSSNFNYCLNNVLTSITSDFLLPIHYAMNLGGETVKDITDSIQMVRKKFKSLIDNLENINNELFSKVFSFIIPIQHMFIKFRYILLKTNTTMLTTIYSMIAGYLGLKSFAGAFVQIMIIGLLSLTAMIIPLLLFVFSAPLAVPLLVAFSIVAGFTTSVIVGLEDVIHMSTKSVPHKPHCFDPETEIQLQSGEIKQIRKIAIGDILNDGSKVTGVFKVSRNNMDMYLYKNVVVSGCHNIINHNTNISTPVCNLVEAIYLHNYTNSILYCLNTDSGIIQINNVCFSDWNDIDANELDIIKANLFDIIPYNLSKNNLHTYLESGFVGETKIDLANGGEKNIKDLTIGEKLQGGGRVIGVVVVDSKNTTICNYKILDTSFTSTENITYYLERFGYQNVLYNENKYIQKQILDTKDNPKYLYNILVSNDKFYSNGIQFKDYNFGLEQFL